MDRSQGELGLGLTLVKKLIELHGGTVAASSRRNGKRVRVHDPTPGCRWAG